MAVVVLVAIWAATVGWGTTASATVDPVCQQSVRADGETLYRAAVTVLGATIPPALPIQHLHLRGRR